MCITATFLDEVSFDIPCNNWGAAQWERDFMLMKALGIHTVVMIRSGMGRNIAFPSRVLERHMNPYPVLVDYADLFLRLAEKYGMKFYFPTYDSWQFWMQGDIARELEINLELIEEVWEKYGHYASFAGWYLTHEFGREYPGVPEAVHRLGGRCKELSGELPTMMSPYMLGPKADPNQQLTFDEHRRQWEKIITTLKGAVDIVAFQDGHVDFHDLPGFIAANKQIIESHGMQCWSNVETFDRDMPFNFPPIDWRKMWWKMETAKKAGIQDFITFEFSHFLSPFSTWPASRNLFLRYCEYLDLDGPGLIAQARQICDL